MLKMNKKNIFLFNLEWVEVLKELPPEVKYKVYDAIIEYASTGEILTLEAIAKGVFMFIKREMDYNNNQYNKAVESRREAGKKSGEARKKRAKGTSVHFVEQTETKGTKRTNSTDNENENDNKHSKECYNARARKTDAKAIIEAFFDESRRGAIEQFAMQCHISIERLRAMSEAIATEWELAGVTHTDQSNAFTHLMNMIRNRALKQTINETQSQDRYANRRGADSKARCPEDYTDKI